MRSKRSCLVLLLVAFTITGCGGGGGKGSVTGPGPDPVTSLTFSVPASQATEKTVGNVSISIPAHTFAQDTQMTVELHPVSLRPANPEIGTIGNEVILSPTTAPNDTITVTENATMSRSAPPYYLPISWIGGKWRKIGEATQALGRIQAAIDPKWFATNRSMSVLLSSINAPLDYNIHLTYLAGDPNNLNDHIAFLVHGIMSDENAMKPLGQALVAKGLYKTAWGLHYDWRLPTDYVSTELGNVLTSCQTVDLFGHSRGALICRYTLEILQKRPQTLVNKVVLICGPNKGSKLDPEIGLLTSLQESFLNDGEATGFPVVGTPAVQELTAESDVLRALNSHGCNSNLGIRYYLFAAESDSAVDVDSALAHGVDMECFTGMTVVRETLAGSHSTLVSDPGGIENMLSYL